MRPDISVVICVYNGADTLGDSLRAVQAQSFPRHAYEVIVVDDGSTDDSADVAAGFDVRLLRRRHYGLAAARNAGWQATLGDWVAFTDDDCGPTRHWLQSLHAVVHQGANNGRVLGAAGRIVGYPSPLAVPRYVERTGGFNTERHLQHPTFPYAPMGNAMYRREALQAVNGLDERYSSYESCDLHTRLRRTYGGTFYYEPRAVVFHRHHTHWRDYFRQQRGYGRGLAQFMWHYRDEVPWSLRREWTSWRQTLALGAAALVSSTGEPALVRRGEFVKHLALRLGFLETYWSKRERRRW
ncbi:MAG: glycosyltransferase [Deltaproteobacteria bacterium]|nr:glycosyltransferase [Deltaproteobacteria bacterium]